jgi:ornithine cyclodeaminase/alanine dehydrogenase-like protein (mu-crystallin family)
MVLLLLEDDVRKILTFDDVLEAVEDAYLQYGKGLAGGNYLHHARPPPPRFEVRVKGKDLPHLDPRIRALSQRMAYLEETGMAFLGWSFHIGDKRAYMSYLIDAKTGEILAIIKAPYTEGVMRTGCAGAIASKYLSRTDSNIVGVIGTGMQGRSQILALSKVRDLKKVFAYAGREEDAPFTKVYVNEMNKRLGIEFIACNSAEEVVRNAKDVLVTCTKSTKPYVKGEWLNEGIHITAIGADDPNKIENGVSVLKKVDKIIIDDELALSTGELRLPLSQGDLTYDDIYANIGEIVAGVKPARENPSEITYFKSQGMTMAYVTINAFVFKKAKELGLGQEIDKNFEKLLYSSTWLGGKQSPL